ncbi:hypothetical protein B0J14DRAFT_116780 [Halenospora varia]|nr:hypothetical protein B0J14DRAFT_116780 [Halenospora varia]
MHLSIPTLFTFAALAACAPVAPRYELPEFPGEIAPSIPTLAAPSVGVSISTTHPHLPTMGVHRPPLSSKSRNCTMHYTMLHTITHTITIPPSPSLTAYPPNPTTTHVDTNPIYSTVAINKPSGKAPAVRAVQHSSSTTTTATTTHSSLPTTTPEQ